MITAIQYWLVLLNATLNVCRDNRTLYTMLIVIQYDESNTERYLLLKIYTVYIFALLSLRKEYSRYSRSLSTTRYLIVFADTKLILKIGYRLYSCFHVLLLAATLIVNSLISICHRVSIHLTIFHLKLKILKLKEIPDNWAASWLLCEIRVAKREKSFLLCWYVYKYYPFRKYHEEDKKGIKGEGNLAITK